MVKFELVTSENGIYTYHYYPEGEFSYLKSTHPSL